MRVRTVVAVAMFTAASFLLVSPARGAGGEGDGDGSAASWSAKCQFVSHLQVDPLSDWGAPPSLRYHTFSGSETPHAELTPAELRAVTEPNECNSPDLTDSSDGEFGLVLDKSQYWAPALRAITVTPKDWIDPEVVLIYYRNAGVDPNTIQPFDQDLTIRAGDPAATDPQNPWEVEWSCVAPDGADRSAGNEVNFNQRIPNWCPKTFDDDEDPLTPEVPFYLRLVVYFPNCIDFGRVTERNEQWLPDEPKYAEVVGGAEFKQCPVRTGWTCEPVPQVQIGYRWPMEEIAGIVTRVGHPNHWDLSALKLASDGAGQTRGVSAHADFMSGWSDADLDVLMRTCFWDADHYVGDPDPPSTYGPRRCGAIGNEAPDWGEN